MLFLGYESAVQYWRAVRAGLIPFPTRSEISSVSGGDHLCRDILEFAPDLPIASQPKPHVLVSQAKLIHRSDKVCYHLCSDTLPKGSFCRHTSYVRVASPELCLLQSAQALGSGGMIALIELCCEFMGGYSLCDGIDRGFTSCEPLIIRADLQEYLDKLPPRTKGAVLLRRAARLAGEGSRSPRETECFLIFSLPPEMGGLGLPQPMMNPPLPVEDGSLTDDEGYMVDLSWEDRKVIFEYDGERDHSSHEQVKRDKERRSVLASLGYTVIVAVNDSVNDTERFKKKASQVFRALGRQLPENCEDEDGLAASLRTTLFNPLHHYSSPYTTPIIPDQKPLDDSEA